MKIQNKQMRRSNGNSPEDISYRKINEALNNYKYWIKVWRRRINKAQLKHKQIRKVNIQLDATKSKMEIPMKAPTVHGHDSHDLLLHPQHNPNKVNDGKRKDV